jgi:c-di-GMP-binding flagellar brake protein YcgR
MDDNPEGLKFPGVLEVLDEKHIKVKMEPDFVRAPRSAVVRVEFTMANFKFHFDSTVDVKREGDFICIVKPSRIFKSTIRKGKRLKLNTQIGYNVWTEPGLHNAILTDLSSVGMKFITTRPLVKDTLLNVNVYLPGKSLRFICQAMVRWCIRDAEVETKYTCGVLFTTLSNDATKRVEKFIADELKGAGEEASFS